MIKKLYASYSGVFNIFKMYWAAYGGFSSLIISPYFHLAILIAWLLQPYWISGQWWNTSISILPNIVGFALGGYAILVGFGDDKFMKVISRKSEKTKVSYSPFLEVSAAFAHFIIVQLLALFFAIIAIGISVDGVIKLGEKSVGPIIFGWDFSYILTKTPALFNATGFFLFIYALLAAVAATLSIFRVTSWFDRINNMSNNEGN
ncbi:hypothetical protein ICN11_05015 [Polynucleobacter sp. 78F-HAINBA]|uniref:hypothetical protein n=1 Tax=Polynucleobacter sp. 78F-HAINBA TaxID=2689099 RepID=UPI001C0CC92B|nr:hypothetical protein [Polynucleobacter sp. 78F-HAINBA]MBU3591376.1 hypothetical protein [Polynucleobacter sp. 78F-HAINBA]